MRLIHADCVDAMRELAEASVDAVVCDPPYGLEFMNKEWDRLGPTTGRADIRPSTTHIESGDDLTDKRGRTYGYPKKNKRCRRCGQYAFDRNRCTCPTPDWDTRTSEYARVMQTWHEEWATAALRVLKPGGYLLAFGGTRTYHRLACAIEDAGFEIRDCLAWLYGSGFPKSLDVSKAIDKAAGAERQVVGLRTDGVGNTAASIHKAEGFAASRETIYEVTAPATDGARAWQGWGTALKPAFEPIVVARKPLAENTVAANVLRFGTGAINVDDCRIGTETLPPTVRGVSRIGTFEGADGNVTPERLGRWPANVAFDEAAARQLDEQSGESSSPVTRPRSPDGPPQATWSLGRTGGIQVGHGDTGGASRFFYTAKASRAEREEGVSLRALSASERTGRAEGSAGLVMAGGKANPFAGNSGAVPQRNHHPTVKPVDLMRWLVRLVTPPGGLVLDPFTGSGTTGIAAKLEGFDFIGIEREAEYVAIAERRIANANSYALAEETEEQPSLFAQMPLEGVIPG